jgi:hypothetical protein
MCITIKQGLTALLFFRGSSRSVLQKQSHPILPGMASCWLA